MSLLALESISLKTEANKLILDNISYQVRPQDFIIVLGSNGSGKSSLLKILDRRYQPTQGAVFLENKAYSAYAPKHFNQALITLTQQYQESLFPSLTIYENFLLVVKNKNQKNREFFANYLADFNVKLSKNLNQVVNSLSGGEQQTLALALKVLYPPKILLLDEHTSALDPKTATHLMQLTAAVVQNHKMTCILATHDLQLALTYGNRILALRQGQVFQQYDDVLIKEKLTEQGLLAACY